MQKTLTSLRKARVQAFSKVYGFLRSLRLVEMTDINGATNADFAGSYPRSGR